LIHVHPSGSISEGLVPSHHIDLSTLIHFTPQETTCAHLGLIAPVRPSARGCEECLQLGSRWVHLRICLTCGHVGCCDSSPHRHASAHSRAAGHPIVRSMEPGETWAWCYEDEVMLKDSEPRPS
jgi:uncharacterized UBP type Zn finger protein